MNNSLLSNSLLPQLALSENLSYKKKSKTFFNAVLLASLHVKHMINNLETQKTTYEQYKSNLLDFINGVNKFYEFTNENYLKPIKYGIKMYNGYMKQSKYRILRDGLEPCTPRNHNTYVRVKKGVIKANDWLSEYKGNILLSYKDGGFKVFKNNNRLKQILELNHSYDYDITEFLDKIGRTRFPNTKDWLKWGVTKFNYSLLEEVKSTFQPKKIIANFKGAKGIIGKTGVTLGGSIQIYV